MKMMLRTCAALLAAGVLVSTSVALAINWSGNKQPGFHVFTDPHGHILDIAVHTFILPNATISSLRNSAGTGHKAASICAINGVPTVVQNGPIQFGTNWSIAGCPFPTTILGGAGAIHP
jgi:hypothetical protein